jgi:two-component system chemotaxis response regulator CheB
LARKLAGKAVSELVRERYAALAAETEKALAVLRERIAVAVAETGASDDG